MHSPPAPIATMPFPLLALALIVAGLLVLALRAPRVARRAQREIGRHPARTALLMCALAPPTAIITGALGVLDTADATLRAVAFARSGTVDEVVVLNPLPPDPADRFDLVAGNPFGGYAATERGFFPEGEFARLAVATRGSAAIAAIAPAIADDVAVLDGTGTRPLATVGLLALAAPDTDAFGVFLAPDGQPIRLEGLPPDSVIINAAAAAALRVGPGADIRLRLDRGPLGGWRVRVAAVVENGKLGGVQPLVLAPLARVQGLTGREGQINHLLVANRGDGATERASRELRWLLVDRTQADRLRAALAQPEGQRALERAARAATGRERDRLLAVRSEALASATSERFVGLVSELYLRKRLVAISDDIRDGGLRRAVFAGLTNLNTLSVVEGGDEGTAGADAYAGAAMGGFLALGGVALGGASALSWAVTARLTARRRHGGGYLFLLGACHALGGAALGTLAGVGGLWAASAMLAGPGRRAGIRLAVDIAPGAVVSGAASGLLISLLTVGIVARVRSRPHPTARSFDYGTAAWAILGIIGALAALLAATLGAGWQRLLLWPTLGSCVLLGGTAILRSLPAGLGAARAAPRRGWLVPAAAAAAFLVWIQVLAALPSPSATNRENVVAALMGSGAALFAGIWATTSGLNAALAALERVAILPSASRAAFGRVARALAPGRLARACSAIVTLAAIAALALGAALAGAFITERPAIGGFDLRIDRRTPTSGETTDSDALARALREIAASDRARIAGIGGLASTEAWVAAEGAMPDDWRGMHLAGADEGLLAVIAAPFIQRAPDLASDTAAWAALRTRPQSAVISQRALLALPGPTAGTTALSLPFSLVVRPPGGVASEVSVIGIIDPRVALDPGVYVARAQFDAMGARPDSTAWLIAAQPGTAAVLEDALRPALERHRFALAMLNDRQRVGAAALAALNRSVLVFFAIGLFASTAIGTSEMGRVPRRRDGTGPALPPAQIRTQVEIYLVGAAGLLGVAELGLGVGLGFRLAAALTETLAAAIPAHDFVFPWAQVGAILLLGWLGALGTLLRGAGTGPAPAE